MQIGSVDSGPMGSSVAELLTGAPADEEHPRRFSRINPFQLLLDAAQARSLERMAAGARRGAQALNRVDAVSEMTEPPDWLFDAPHPSETGEVNILLPTSAEYARGQLRSTLDAEPDASHSLEAGSVIDSVRGEFNGDDSGLPSLMIVAGYYGLTAEDVARVKSSMKLNAGEQAQSIAQSCAYIAADIEVLIDSHRAKRMILGTDMVLRGIFAGSLSVEESDERGVSVQILAPQKAVVSNN